MNLFITGTGTGVGKTLLTALLLRHLRQEGHDALAVKPFCSGSRHDVHLLQSLQKHQLTLPQANPFFYRPPLAPWAAARRNRTPPIPLRRVLRQIRAIRQRCQTLLIEGSGGLFVPLGNNYMVADLILKIPCQTLLVAPNCLGTINHTLLTVKCMQTVGIKDIKIIMMSQKTPDFSSHSNINTIRAFLPRTPIFSIPYLGPGASTVTNVKKNAKYLKKTLARILGGANLCPVPSKRKKRLFNKTR